MRTAASLLIAALAFAGATGCSASAEEEDVATGDSALETPDDANDFYVIAHMTNTPDAVRWAVAEGANAVEIDLRFDDDGTPESFKHGGVCDCLCGIGNGHVCSVLEGKCDATSPVPDLLASIRAIPAVSLVLIDSKMKGDESEEAQRSAGARVIDAVTTGLFARGYRGKVVVGAPKTNARVYIEAASREAARSPFANRMSFAFDQMGKSAAAAECTLDTLGSFTHNRVFGTGVSACAVGDYEPAIRAAASQERAGDSGLTYVWTLDREDSMRRYIDAGARGIITNRPGKLADLAREMGKSMAKPTTILRAAATVSANANAASCAD